MDEQATGKSRQENRQQESQTQQGLSRGQNRGGESYGMERRSQGNVGYPSVFSVSTGEIFTMSPITLMRRFTEDIDRAFGFCTNRGSAASSEQELGWMPRVE